MDYSTIYVGMDVHKESFSLCCYTREKEKAEYSQKIEPDYQKVLNYIEAMRFHYGKDAVFLCGYEAGCLGFTLYHQLTDSGVGCIILAPTTMSKPAGRKVKTDKRDAALISRCLAHNDYKPVNIPTSQDDQVKEYIRMRDDVKLAVKKVKQQILAFCLRHNCVYGESSRWTQAHLKWLRSLDLQGLYGETLSEYLDTFDRLTEKLRRIELRIEELAEDDLYRESVHKLVCFLGIRSLTALALVVETGDFSRFATAEQYASYLGLTPGEHTSSENQTRLGITKAGNSHLRRLLIESAQSYSRGKVGFKSKELEKRQSGNAAKVIAYADRANERLRRRYYKLVLGSGKLKNVAKTAIARELACFIWGMMTGNIG